MGRSTWVANGARVRTRASAGVRRVLRLPRPAVNGPPRAGSGQFSPATDRKTLPTSSVRSGSADRLAHVAPGDVDARERGRADGLGTEHPRQCGAEDLTEKAVGVGLGLPEGDDA